MNTKEIVKELASKRKLTIAELERNLNIANGTIGKWGRQKPSIDTLQKLADYFQVSVDYLLGREDAAEKMYGARGELLAAHIDDDVSEEDMDDILRYIEFRKNNPL